MTRLTDRRWAESISGSARVGPELRITMGMGERAGGMSEEKVEVEEEEEVEME